MVLKLTVGALLVGGGITSLGEGSRPMKDWGRGRPQSRRVSTLCLCNPDRL